MQLQDGCLHFDLFSVNFLDVGEMVQHHCVERASILAHYSSRRSAHIAIEVLEFAWAEAAFELAVLKWALNSYIESGDGLGVIRNLVKHAVKLVLDVVL